MQLLLFPEELITSSSYSIAHTLVWLYSSTVPIENINSLQAYSSNTCTIYFTWLSTDVPHFPIRSSPSIISLLLSSELISVLYF